VPVAVAAAVAEETPRSAVVGVVWDGQPGVAPFLLDVLDGMRRRLGERGLDTLLLAPPVPAPGGDPGVYLRRARVLRLDGVVLLGVNPRDPAVETLAASDVPCVGVDVDIHGPRTAWLTSDNLGGAATAVRHLHSGGCRRIATITGPMYLRPSVERLLGVRRELGVLGATLPAAYTVEGDLSAASGEAAMRRLLALPEPPDGVFVAGDAMAAGALLAVASAGLSVPGDVAVVGFDDAALAGYTRPRLTTVRQDAAAFARIAAELVTAVREADVPPTVLPTELVVRESCRVRR
jgi:LacI family transcriptional regulator